MLAAKQRRRRWKHMWEQALLGGGGGNAYYAKMLSLVQQYGGIQYFSLNEAAGATAVADHSPEGNNGVASGVTFGAAGIGDGFTAASFGASPTGIDAYSAGLVADFVGTEGTMMAWGKVPASVWTDGAARGLAYISVDGTTTAAIGRDGTNNSLSGSYNAGGVSRSRNVTTSTLDWFHAAITWSDTADQFIFYFNGAAVGAPQTVGTWVGDPASNRCGIGCRIPYTVDLWTGGFLAHYVLFPVALPAAAILSAATR